MSLVAFYHGQIELCIIMFIEMYFKETEPIMRISWFSLISLISQTFGNFKLMNYEVYNGKK